MVEMMVIVLSWCEREMRRGEGAWSRSLSAKRGGVWSVVRLVVVVRVLLLLMR
jgi:hypothetical protein